MKKLFENKVVVGGICIVIAAVLAFLVLPGMYKKKEKTIMVCKLQTEIAAGTKIEKEMLKEVEVGSYGLPESVVKNPDDIMGKYAKISMTPDDYLLSSRFEDYVSDEKLDKVIAEGKRLVAVSVPTNAASVANQLRKGDKVTVVYYADDAVVTDNDLCGLEIYSVENEDAQNLEDLQSSDDVDNTIAASVTLIVTEEQAIKLVEAEYSGKVHLILESRGVV